MERSTSPYTAKSEFAMSKKTDITPAVLRKLLRYDPDTGIDQPGDLVRPDGGSDQPDISVDDLVEAVE